MTTVADTTILPEWAYDFTYNYGNMWDLNCQLIKDNEEFLITVEWNSLSAEIKINKDAPPGMTQFLGQINIQDHVLISAPTLLEILNVTALCFIRHCLLNRKSLPLPNKTEKN